MIGISNNPITDFSPLAGLSNLHALYANWTNLSDLSFLSGKTGLEYVEINNTKVSDISILANFPGIVSVAISGCPITDISPLQNLHLLYYLSLSDLNLEDSDVQILADKTLLMYLQLYNNNISDLDFLRNLNNLHNLVLDENPIVDFSALSDLLNIQYLNLSYTGFSDLNILKNIPNLNYLTLYNNDIRDISPLMDMQLDYVYLNDNPLSNKTILVDIPALISTGVNVYYSPVRGLAILGPDNSSTIPTGSNIEIKWKNEDCQWQCSGGAQWVNIDLSTDGGNTWQNLVQNTDNDGSYEWLVPDIQSTNCLLKISDAEVPGDVFTLSSEPFSIPQVETVVTFPDPILEAKIREALGGFQGELTTSVLKQLTQFYASFAGIQDLTGIEYCTNLEWLNVYGNQITDVSPVNGLKIWGLDIGFNPINDLSSLNSSSLTLLWCSQIGITDLSFLNNMPQLNVLVVDDNPITDFSAIANLPVLSTLALRGTQPSDFSQITRCTSLQYLQLGYANVSNISGIENLVNLISLDIADNPLTDISPIFNLPNLQTLSISGLNLNNLNFVENLPNLWTLYLDRNNVTDISPLTQLPNLSYLYLGANPIMDYSPLSSIPNLQALSVSFSNFSDLTVLQGLPNLNQVYAYDSEISNIDPLFQFPALQFIELIGNPLSNKTIATKIPELISKGVGVSYPEMLAPFMLEPVPGSELTAGTSYEIKWRNGDCWWNCGAGAENVNLELSTDFGQTWMNIVQSTPNDGVYEWTIPSVESYDCVIRVSDSDFPELFSITQGNFTIIRKTTEDPAPLVLVQKVLDEMKAFGSFPSSVAKKDLEKAIKAVEKSLVASLWLDDNHVDSKTGEGVFVEHKSAVKDLDKLKKNSDELGLAAAQWSAAFVLADRMLDSILFIDIADVIDGCNDTPNTNDCQKNFKDLKFSETNYVNALAEVEKGNNDKAIDEFKKAWRTIQNIVDRSLGKTVADWASVVPNSFELGQNYPNPFNPSTVIRFGLPSNSMVTVRVYNSIGEEVITLVNGILEAGYHETEFNAAKLASGLYICRFEAVSESGEKFVQSNKMLLMK